MEPGNPICKLCHLGSEDFIIHCPSLSVHRQDMLSDVPAYVRSLLPDISSEPVRFLDVMLGSEWIKDHDIQIFNVDFLDNLLDFRNSLLLAA